MINEKRLNELTVKYQFMKLEELKKEKEGLLAIMSRLCMSRNLKEDEEEFMQARIDKVNYFIEKNNV